MKKLLVISLLSITFLSCGSHETKPIEATYDSVGVDSSNILPPLVNPEQPQPNDTPKGLDTLKAID